MADPNSWFNDAVRRAAGRAPAPVDEAPPELVPLSPGDPDSLLVPEGYQFPDLAQGARTPATGNGTPDMSDVIRGAARDLAARRAGAVSEARAERLGPLR